MLEQEALSVEGNKFHLYTFVRFRYNWKWESKGFEVYKILNGKESYTSN